MVVDGGGMGSGGDVDPHAVDVEGGVVPPGGGGRGQARGRAGAPRAPRLGQLRVRVERVGQPRRVQVVVRVLIAQQPVLEKDIVFFDLLRGGYGGHAQEGGVGASCIRHWVQSGQQVRPHQLPTQHNIRGDRHLIAAPRGPNG